MDRRDFLESFTICSACCAAGLAGCGKGGESAQSAAVPEPGDPAEVAQQAEQAQASAEGPGCAPCGRTCSTCPALANGQCGGCRGETSELKNPECAIRACAEERGVETCAACGGFPCPKLEQWAARSEANRAGLDRLTAMAEEQQ